MLQAFDQILGQQLGHQLCWSGVELAVDVNADGVEECLVPVLASNRSGFGVGLADVGDHAQCPIQVLSNGVGFDLGGFQVGVSLTEFQRDAILLSLQHVDADGVVEVGLQDLVPLDLQPSDALGLLVGLDLRMGGAVLQRLVDEFSDPGLALVTQVNGRVVVDDLLLDDIDWQVRQLALAAVLLVSEAEEVVVEPTPASAGAREAES